MKNRGYKHINNNPPELDEGSYMEITPYTPKYDPQKMEQIIHTPKYDTQTNVKKPIQPHLDPVVINEILPISVPNIMNSLT